MAQKKPNITYTKTSSGMTINIGGGGGPTSKKFMSMPGMGQPFWAGMKSFPVNQQPHVYPEKEVKNQFNFNGSTIDNCAIGGKGPTTFNTKHTVYQPGSQHNKVDIHGGTFNQSTIGGEAEYLNKNSSVMAGDGGTSGVPRRGNWNYDVEQAVLVALKKGLTTDQLLRAIEKGKTIKELCDVLERLDSSQVPIMYDSWLNSKADDMEQ